MNWATQLFQGSSSHWLGDTMKRLRRKVWQSFWTAILVLVVIAVLDDDPTAWEKTRAVVERILFGGLLPY